MTETITAAISPALEHIIERPRLIARLEEGGGARVTVLAAPAGYGKTTLARQWSQRQAGAIAWYRTTRASGDVALLAVQIDELLASIAPEIPREPPTVASIASVNPSPKPLGRAILRTFESLTRDVLLVVDEWEAAGTGEAEELLSMLVEGLEIRFLITTRARPEWFTPRLEVYGEGLEVGLDELAMTDDEAAEVLAALGAVGGRARLMRTADGWPAVLGLAAMSGDVDFTSSRLLSHTLYDFLASELLAGAAAETQEALMLLAVASISDLEVARMVLGVGANDLIEDAVSRGLLGVADRRTISLHPLLRELLIRRFAEADTSVREGLLSRCRSLFAARLWDEALCVAEEALDAAFVTEAVAAALDDLLAAGRTSSLKRWVAAARTAGAEGGLIDYAESEALLRGADFDRAMALATQAAGSLDGDLAARAHLVAGRSAHLLDRSRRNERHADLAAAAAETAETREEALWLRFVLAFERQEQDLRRQLDEFRASSETGLKQSLRLATGELCIAMVDGGLTDALNDARSVIAIATKAADPIAHTGLLSGYSYVLIMNGQYEAALQGIDDLANVAEECGIEFPSLYAQLYRAKALVGLRRFSAAGRALSTLERQTKNEAGNYFRRNLTIQRARLYASVSDLSGALDVLSLGPFASSSRSARGEFLGWQALLMAASGESERPRELAIEARRASCGLEARTLGLLANTIVSLNERRNAAAAKNLRAAVVGEFWDPVVIAVRASPQLGAFIAEQTELRPWFQRLLAASSDTSLANSLGLRVPRTAKPKRGLSPRESEVHELIALGLTNEEIGRLLFISLSTTKVHVKHIFEKLGVRSRLEAARALRDDV
jgi:LuxR family maltose regulon positive regulatory protein